MRDKRKTAKSYDRKTLRKCEKLRDRKRFGKKERKTGKERTRPYTRLSQSRAVGQGQ